jgi:hypothetical protein
MGEVRWGWSLPHITFPHAPPIKGGGRSTNPHYYYRSDTVANLTG